MANAPVPSSYFHRSARPRLGSTASRQVSLWLPEPLVQRLADEVGNPNGLSLSDSIRTTLETGLDARKKQCQVEKEKEEK